MKEETPLEKLADLLRDQITKAGRADNTAEECVHYTQSICNVLSAIRTIQDVKIQLKQRK